ncbi:MAG: NAD(P)/FAD-dependent oxidoreductase [Nannocystaceae bacterium]
MTNDDPRSEADVVVIGAGIGGLTAAALLARAGLDVCVFEQDSRPGGYLAGFRRRRFSFDTAIHWLNQCGPDGVVTSLLDHIDEGCPRAQPLQAVRRYRGDTHDYLLSIDADNLRDDLVRDAPHEKDAIAGFFRASRRIGSIFHDLSYLMRAPESMGRVEYARKRIQLAKLTLPMMKWARHGTDHAFGRVFASKLLRQLFCSDQRLMSCLTPVGWAYDGDYQVPPAGGSQAYPHFLAKSILSRGGTISYRSRVDEITVQNGTATGVRFEKGRRNVQRGSIKCSHVLAACDLRTVYEQLLPQGTIGSKLLGRVRNADIYDSTVTVFLGLNAPARALGLGEELTFLTRNNPRIEAHNNGNPHTSAITVLVPSLRDPTLAPEGKSTLTLSTAANIRYGDRWKTGPNDARGEAYRAFKRAYADVLVDRVEKGLGCEIRDQIEVIEVATPVTHQRYTGNTDGSIMATKPSHANIRNRIAGYLTPVKNLLLASHWAEYGGGVPISVRAGANCALLVLRGRNTAAFEGLRAVLDGETRLRPGS